MKLKLTRFNGDVIEVDSKNIDYLNSMEEAGRNDEGTLIMTMKDKDVKRVQETIPDMFSQAYKLGYKDGSKEMKSTLLSPASIEGRPTVDIETVPDEDEPELKGYILSDVGRYINVNQIMCFRKNTVVKECVMVYDSCGNSHDFSMSMDEFKKMLAKAQEELK